jgi:hypothetical protein
MFSNNPKVASFYPTAKKTNHFNNYQNANFINQNLGNQNVNNEFNFINNNSLSDSVELALITVNLNYPRFKSMNIYELETYIKNMAINNAYDNKKYFLALNILLNEAKKIQQSLIIKQNISQNEKSKIEPKINNSIDFNNVAVIEPDEFNLDINSEINKPTPQSNFFIKQDFTNQTNVSQPKFTIKQNRNLDLSTFHGNPFGVTKITNNNPVSSVRPINRTNENISNFNTTINNNDNSSYYETATNFASNDFSDNFSQRSLTTSNIIKQDSFIQNPSTVFASGGKRRTSNLDVGSSNNYLTFQ